MKLQIEGEVIYPLADLSDTGHMEGFRKIKKNNALKNRMKIGSRVRHRVDVLNQSGISF